MTTILADTRFGVMVADSSFSDDDRVWSGRKVFRIKGALVGVSGDVDDWTNVLTWMRKGGKEPAFGTASVLVLSASGLVAYNGSATAERIASGREAVGTGAKAAMCAYEALGFTDPKKAVAIVCKHDAASRTPVRVYRLAGA